MKQGSQKQKGNNFENAVAKKLSMWITYGQRKEVFDRSPASGAKATAHAKKGILYKNQAGDIVALEDLGYAVTNKFIIECKHYRDLNLNGLVYGNKTGVLEFWLKLLKECKEFKKQPMLIARQNHRPILLGFNKYGIELFDCLDLVRAIYPTYGLHLIKLDEFLDAVDPVKYLDIKIQRRSIS